MVKIKEIGIVLLYLMLCMTALYGQQSDFEKAIAQAQNGEYEKATNYFLQEYTLGHSEQDTSQMIIASRMLGNVFSLINDTVNRKKYYLLSIDLSREFGDEQALLYSLMSLSYMYVGDYESKRALEVCEEAIHLIKTTENNTVKNDTSTIGAIYINTGAAYGRLGNTSKALHHYLIALSYFEKFSNPRREMVKLYTNIADCYRDQNLKEKSRNFHENALNLALTLGIQHDIQSAVDGLYKWHKKFGEPEVALEYLEKSIQLKDSLLNINVISSVEELHSKYQSDQLKKQITVLSETNKQHNEKIQSTRLWIFLLIAVLLVIAGIAVSLILFQRFALRTQQLEFERNQADLRQRVLTAQMNPHFLFNSLNSIQRMYLEGNTDEANNYMANFGTLLRKVLTYSSLEKIELSKDIELLKMYLELERNRVDIDFYFSITTDSEVDVSFIKVPPLLVQPFVENAIWHGIVPLNRTGQIEVHYSIEKDYLRCTVTDNGIGYEKSKNSRKKDHVSKGVSIVRERLSQLPDPVLIRQVGKSGTCVTLKIPFA